VEETMVLPYARDLESLEAINQDDDIRQLVLRMANLARRGQIGDFIAVVGSDDELDQETKDTVLELARDETFLLAAEDYLRTCRTYH
jgi:hypothetical protein